MDIKKINAYAAQAPQKAQEQVPRAPVEDKTVSGQEANVEADRVNWSRGYQEMAQVKKVMMSGDDVRTEQVDQVRNVVNSGSYPIEPAKIAERMLEEAW